MQEQGFEGTPTAIVAMWKNAATTILGFFHEVTLCGDIVLDGTAHQFDSALPTAWISPTPHYLRRLADATGMNHALEGGGAFDTEYPLVDPAAFAVDVRDHLVGAHVAAAGDVSGVDTVVRQQGTPITLSPRMFSSSAQTRTTGSADADRIRTSKPVSCMTFVRSLIWV